MMKKFLVVSLLVVSMFAAMAQATVDVNATYVSKYIWRGYDLNSAQPAIQPGVSYAFGDSGVSLGLWGSYNVGSTSKQELTELDLTLGYDFSYESVDYSVGYTYYTFPNLSGASAKSGEIYLGATLSQVMFTPGLTVYYDHDQGNGLYSALSAGYDFGVVSSGLTIGYNSGQWAAKSGTTDITLALSKEFSVGSVTITPSASYALISDTSVNANSSEFWVGLDVAGSI